MKAVAAPVPQRHEINEENEISLDAARSLAMTPRVRGGDDKYDKSSAVLGLAAGGGMTRGADAHPHNEVLLFPDGRRLRRVPSHRGGVVSEAAIALVTDAHRAGIVLVADHATLVIVSPPAASDALLRRLTETAADVLARLHAASNVRMGVDEP